MSMYTNLTALEINKELYYYFESRAVSSILWLFGF